MSIKTNAENLQYSEKKNSSSDKKYIKSIDIKTKEFILTPTKPNKESDKKKYKFLKCCYSTEKKNAKINPDKKGVILKLHSARKNSILNCINNTRNLDLLKNQNKKLNEERHKIKTKINNSENAQKLREQRKIDYIKKKNYLSSIIKEREREMKEKKDRVRIMKNEEIARFKNLINYRIIHSENLSERKRILKKKILQDISDEKNKINEEKRRKMNLIKILDDDISKRKAEREKIKKLIKKEKLEQEIKEQENINKKLEIKIREYEEIGLTKINFIQKIRLKLENKF